MRRIVCFSLLTAVALTLGSQTRNQWLPGSRSVMDAHNCYPYWEWWHDRIDRALSAGTPLAIEQDLYWYTDPKTGKSWSVVAHGDPVSGHEPTMEHYFFDRVRPIVEKALREGNHGNWPLITLNLDLKTEEPAHLHAIWALLEVPGLADDGFEGHGPERSAAAHGAADSGSDRGVGCAAGCLL